MPNQDAKNQWEEYRESEMREVAPILEELGFSLDETQVHTAGERFLMAGARDVGGGGYKLVLLGKRRSDGMRAVIKVSSEPLGIQEIQTERRARETLRTLKFAYRALYAPEELLYTTRGKFTVFVTAYIDQDRAFLSRTTEEQFMLALGALKAQEGVHATTYSHTKVIRSVFGIWSAREYLDSFAGFTREATHNDPENSALAETLRSAGVFLAKHRDTIEQYCGFLTHADFVPHNLRVHSGNTYLLDSASLHFGNKYESWARFANFMLLYNRPLERALTQYVRDNRTPEEQLSLRLMRIYKLGKLLEYHAGTLPRTSGSLHALEKKRVAFWRAALESLLAEKPLADELVARYQNERDTLRSEEEKNRQKELH